MRFYSIIVPVYNRPDEVDELLQSLSEQTHRHFEVLIIEDGSTITCSDVVDKYQEKLQLRYFFKENAGQGFARNYGFARSKGDYLIVFDSDCLIPADYLKIVDEFLNQDLVDAFGGPDRAHADFNSLQKAISYSMTSPFTTGGIRGGKRHIGTFHPRSFNMGISKEVYEKTGGYKITRMGEDLEFSIRIIKEGFKTALIQDAYVFHKRRTSLLQFYKQLHFFGRARINVNRYFPGELKAVHMLPTAFVLGLVLWLSTFFWGPLLFTIGGGFLSFYFTLVLWHASLKNHDISVGALSICTSFIQLFAYGVGLIQELIAPRGNQPFAQK
jgi:glycosyltransferase involved in cell wall biosynthesis